MNGFIHLFDPNQTALPKRITDPTMTPRTLHDNSQFFRGSCDAEQNTDPYLQHGLEMRCTRNSNDRCGLYTESSRASCSSSPLSSFSSLDYSKVMHPEPASYDRIIFPESPLLDRSLSHSSSSWRMRQRSFDLDDAVKDLPCTIEDESVLLKHQDTLRQFQPTKLSVGSTNELGSLRAPLKFNDSLCFEDRKPSRLLDESKDDRYERTEFGCYRHDETKERHENSGISHEVARLPLDSSTECSGPNSIMSTTHHNQRPPSIVEKLMGLEAMPGTTFCHSKQLQHVKNGERQESNMILKSTATDTACMPIKVSSAQRCTMKDHTVHKWKNSELVMKPVSSWRIFIEPAPWKQPAIKSKQGLACESDGISALYSKFEGRLKDLKALKQMLDAVQQNGSWQAENKTQRNGMTMNHIPESDMVPKTVQREMNQNPYISVANGEQVSCAKALKSPIVLMKPFKLLAKSDIYASSVIQSEGMQHLSKPQGSESAVRRKALSNTQTVKGPNPRHGYQSPPISPSEKKQTHKQQTVCQPLLKNKKTNSSVSAGSPSPIMQPKKFEFQKKPRPATTAHDVTKPSMPQSKHPRNSCTLGKKPRPKYSTQQCDAQHSGFSAESKDTSCGDDTEVTSKLRLNHIDGSRSPARKVARPMFSGIRKHKPSGTSIEDTPLAHPATVATEQPSPVSVLDSSAYMNDPSSQFIRKTPANCGSAEVVTNMSREKLKQIDDLVHKLNGVGSTYDDISSTDFIASLCKTTNPDQRYISKILLASGLLFRDLESSSTTFQPHISGYPINPELFHVLEQTKSVTLLSEDRSKLSASKSHRRLIFDSCNEILLELLIPAAMSNNSPSKLRILARGKITAGQLLKDMCDRIEQLQAKNSQKGKAEQEEGHDEDDGLKKNVHEDIMLKSDKWGNSTECMPEVVLDIERMLFKDLVNEIVNDEDVSYAMRAKARRSCDRNLNFNKIL